MSINHERSPVEERGRVKWEGKWKNREEEEREKETYQHFDSKH